VAGASRADAMPPARCRAAATPADKHRRGGASHADWTRDW